MFSRLRSYAAITAVAFSAAAPAYSAVTEYAFDKNHTDIVWHASHFGFSDSSGKFTEFDGTIAIDGDEPEKSMVSIVIDTDSVLTGIEKFDQHLTGADFFDSEQFPKATFKSTRVEVKDDKNATVYGDLTLHGVTKEVPLEVTLNKKGVNPYNKKETIGFSGHTTIKRSEFGINYALPGIPDDVKITVDAEAVHNEE